VSRLNSLLAPLPAWARPTNPVLRYIIRRERRRQNTIWRTIGLLLTLAIIGAAFTVSYDLYRHGYLGYLSRNGESGLYTTAYIPLALLQFTVIMTGSSLAVSLGLTSPMMPLNQQRETWEIVKVTPYGAELTLRSRWAGVYYYVAWMLIGLTLLRAILIGQMLADLLHSKSYHFAAYTAGITPGVPTWGRGLVLAVFIVAALLQPIVTTGLNAALSLFLSASIRRTLLLRTALGLLTLAELIAFTVAVTAGIVVLDLDPMFRQAQVSVPGRWLVLLSFALMGDQSLRFLNLRTFTQTWVRVDYGIGLGLAIPLAVLLEFLIAVGLVRLAGRQAMRADRE
jgi:hypothetical protein